MMRGRTCGYVALYPSSVKIRYRQLSVSRERRMFGQLVSGFIASCSSCGLVSV